MLFMQFEPLFNQPLFWLFLSFLVLSLLGILVWLVWYFLQPKGFQKFALTEFKSIEAKLAANNPLRFLQETNLLLRRIAIRSFGQPKAVGLTGQDWLEFLEWSRGKTTTRSDKGFVAGSGRFLNWEENPDLPSPEEMQALIKLVTQWIKRHT